MRRLMLIVLAALVLAGAANATPLHRGDKGKRVCAIQWLLSGHKPSAYPWLHPYKPLSPQPRGNDCQYGKRTIAATREAKRRLGFRLYWNGTAGNDFLQILQGKRARPLGYIARAAAIREAEIAERKRLELAARQTYGARIIALGRTQLGASEHPWGSNWGYPVRTYLAAANIYFPAPWCAAWLQWLFVKSGLGSFANRSAGVFYIRDYARGRGWLRAYPKPGYLIAFLDRLGHIGLVESVAPSGTTTLEGNASNQVLRRFHPFSSYRPRAYIAVPGIERRVP